MARNKNPLRVIVFRVGKPGVVEEIGRTLEAWQKVVDGDVERAPLHNGYEMWCNENGMQEKPFNRMVRAEAWDAKDLKAWSFVIKQDPGLAELDVG